MSNSSFYANGLPYGTDETGLGNVPADTTPTPAPSSFYQSGTVYSTLQNSDELTAEIDADLAAAQAAAAAAAVSETNAASSASSASSSASSASTSASGASSSASAASGSASAAATSASGAATSATNAATSATSASNSATAASGSASSASTSATTATTQAGNASTSATNAAGSATSASTSATNAGNSATAAATSATNAASAVQAAAGTATPLINGTAAVGTGTKWAHEDHVHPTDTTRAPLASPALTGTPTAPTATVGTNTTQIATTAFVLANSSTGGVSSIAGNTGAFTLGDGLTNSTNILKVNPSYLRNYIAGANLSTAGASTTFTVGAGVAADSTNVNLMLLSSSLSKTTSAWAVGNAAGSLDTGSIAATTWYHVYLIRRLDTGVVDVLISLNATTPTLLPTNYSVYRRIGSMKTNASSQWTKFIQDGDRFMWDTPVNDVTSSGTGNTTAVLRTLSVPLGLRVCAQVSCGVNATAAATDLPAAIYLSDPSLSDQVPNFTVAMSFEMYMSTTSGSIAVGGQASCMTNTSSQIRSRLQISTTGTQFSILTNGWLDTRGKDA